MRGAARWDRWRGRSWFSGKRLTHGIIIRASCHFVMCDVPNGKALNEDEKRLNTENAEKAGVGVSRVADKEIAVANVVNCGVARRAAAC